MDRRSFLRLAAATGVGLPFAGSVLAGCGGDDSETSTGAGTGESTGTSGSSAGSSSGPPTKVKIGFIALTDCSSIVLAKELGYFEERGIDASIEKQASWPALRDALVNGDIDAAHCLYSMPLSLATIGEQPDNPFRVAMLLNMNGQAITLNAKDFAGVQYADLDGLRTKLEAKPEKLAMTYPGGTHDLWLRYTLLAAKYTLEAEQIIPIPPPQMVENIRAGTMSGFCVGEPWNAKAVADGIGFTFITTQDIWQDHPEKALVVGKKLSEDTEVLSRMMGAVMQAGKWLDVSENRKQAAQTVSPEKYINTPAANIEGRLTGVYDLGGDLGTKDFAGKQMQFFKDGYVNAPRRSYAIWALAQYRRMGYLDHDPDYEALADKFILSDLYAEVAKAEGVTVPDDDMAPFTVQLDDNEFDPSNPTKEATPRMTPLTTVTVGETPPDLVITAAAAPPAPEPDVAPPRRRSVGSPFVRRLSAVASTLGWALTGIAVFVGLWYLATRSVKDIPTPAQTFDQLREELGRAFRVDEMKGRGIGLEMQSSLWRVVQGFGFAAIVGVPVGLVMGASRRVWQAINPIVQILRPVSPLAWFPIWLRVHDEPAKAAVFVIFITALWPIVVNTAAGAAAVPVDHRNVARVFKFGRIAYLRHVLIPDSLPNILTGLRLSMGVAWMVIVAVEMLSGNSGIGNFTWESYNSGNLAGVAAAIVLIGVVGLALDLMFLRLAALVRRDEH